jgi:quercetin dioxygenase-like cupin family protein
MRFLLLYGRPARNALCALPFVLLFLCVATTASSDQPREAIVHPLQNANFKSTDDPACLSTAVEVGDPSRGPSTVLLKAKKGCFVRWHYHSADHELMLIKGELRVDISMLPSATLGPGGYVFIPSKLKHDFTCTRKSECLIFLTMDRPFDNTWASLGN